MGSIQISRNAFNSGEWTPELWQRSDNALFYAACKTCRNFIPHPRGGASNRAGFQFIYETKFSDQPSGLIPFQFSVVQSYMLEFGDLYFRVYKDGGIVETAVGSGIPVEFVTPYAAADIAGINYEQSADTLFLTHPSYPPQRITRTSHTAWTVTPIPFGSGQAAPSALTGGSGATYNYTVTAVSSAGIESNQSNTVASDRAHTLTWTAPAGTAPQNYNVYEQDAGTGSWFSIGTANTTSYTIPTSVTRDDTLSPPMAIALFGGPDDYPGTVAFHDQRLIFARTNNNPQTMYGSVVGDFYNMDYSSPTQDNDAFNFTMASTQVNEVRFIVSLADAIIGTAGGEWLLRPGGSNTTITPTSVDLAVQSRWGVAANVKPVVIGIDIIFLLGSNRDVRNMTYALATDSYSGNDLTILAAHLFTDNGITQWAYQKHPDSIIWGIRADGALVGFTYVSEQKVAGWHRHDTQGTFESVATISTDGNTDQVWVIVNRTIGGVTRRYVELMADRNFGTIENAFFVDSGLTYSGTPATVFTNLDHLEGCAVSVLADGGVISGLTVVGGSITLPQPASIVQCGLAYTCDLEPLDFTGPLPGGEDLLQKNRSLTQITLAVQNTREVFYGPGLDVNGTDQYLDEVAFRSTEPQGSPTALYTGILRNLSVAPGDVGPASSSVFIRVKNPLPCQIQYLAGTVEYGDD